MNISREELPEMQRPEHLAYMRRCAPLLPPPGDRELIKCLDEIDRLRATLATQPAADRVEVPEGFVLVPRVPTEAMLRAADNASILGNLPAEWAAMLAAAGLAGAALSATATAKGATDA